MKLTGDLFAEKVDIPEKKMKPLPLLLKRIKENGLPTPALEMRFHHTRMWRWDMCWVEYKVAVEVQGGLYMGGGHNRGGDIEGDYDKSNEGQLDGWIVLHFGDHMIRGTTKKLTHGSKRIDPVAIPQIRRALEARGWKEDDPFD